MSGLFITGTDTGVGKTTISLGIIAALQARGLSVAAMKPVAAGCEATPEGLRNDDALRLAEQASVQLPYGLVNPYALAEPIAPHIAASEAGITMNIADLQQAYDEIATQADAVVVEGAGGWLVPLNARETLADLAVALQLPVIMVVGIRLGCLNHALLSAESIRSHGLSLAGWVANEIVPDGVRVSENIAALKKRLQAPLLGRLPYNENWEAEAVAGCLDLGSLK